MGYLIGKKWLPDRCKKAQSGRGNAHSDLVLIAATFGTLAAEKRAKFNIAYNTNGERKMKLPQLVKHIGKLKEVFKRSLQSTAQYEDLCSASRGKKCADKPKPLELLYEKRR